MQFGDVQNRSLHLVVNADESEVSLCFWFNLDDFGLVWDIFYGAEEIVEILFVHNHFTKYLKLYIEFFFNFLGQPSRDVGL